MVAARVVEMAIKIDQFLEGSFIRGRPIILNTGFWGLSGFGGCFDVAVSGFEAVEAGCFFQVSRNTNEKSFYTNFCSICR